MTEGTAVLRQQDRGVGRFQQKVLFAECIAEHVVQALVHLIQRCSPRSARVAFCLFGFPWLSVITIASMRAA